MLLKQMRTELVKEALLIISVPGFLITSMELTWFFFFFLMWYLCTHHSNVCWIVELKIIIFLMYCNFFPLCVCGVRYGWRKEWGLGNCTRTGLNFFVVEESVTYKAASIIADLQLEYPLSLIYFKRKLRHFQKLPEIKNINWLIQNFEE